MRTQIIQVPYDSGYKDYRMGRGPGHIVRHLKAEKNFPVDEVEVHDRFALEVGTSFAVARQLAEKVCNVAGSGAFPLVLAGGCISCVGTLAGLGAPPPAIIWLDAHGDFNTPETTISGFLDGMALATAVGRCWGKLAATVPGFRPVPERQVVLVGAREFDVNERALLDSSAVRNASGTMACVLNWSRCVLKSRHTQGVRTFISILMCSIRPKRGSTGSPPRAA